MIDATKPSPPDEASITTDGEPVVGKKAATCGRKMTRAASITGPDPARTQRTAGRDRHAVRRRQAAVVPLEAPAAGIAFPGGTVTTAADGRMTVTIEPRGGARTLAGSDHRPFAKNLVDAVLATLPARNSADMAERLAAAATALAAFEPGDAVEGMLGAQCVVAFNTSMEASRRATLEGQPFEVAQAYRKAAANASRTFIELLAALDRHRGKGGQQVVRIEHVHVNSGGKAIVGSVTSRTGEGGGVATETLDEPHEANLLARKSSLG